MRHLKRKRSFYLFIYLLVTIIAVSPAAYASASQRYVLSNENVPAAADESALQYSADNLRRTGAEYAQAAISAREANFRFHAVGNTVLLASKMPGKPQNSADGYVKGGGFTVSWDGGSPAWWFKWSTAEKNIASARWQVSSFPMSPDSLHWEYPPGMVAYGSLQPGETEFSIDFSKFAPAKADVFNYWSEKLRIQTLQRPDTITSSLLSALDPASDKRFFKAYTGNIHTLQKASNPTSRISPSIPRILPGLETAKARQSVQKSGSASDMLSLQSKEAITKTLPATRYTYYIRVVLLDLKGKCIGLPSTSLEMYYGTIETGLSDPYETRLLASDLPGMPPSTGEFHKYVESSTPFIDWKKSDQRWWFKWGNNRENILHTVWQLSPVPFPPGKEWKDIPNIAASGTLAPDETRFSVDFSKVAPNLDKSKPYQIKLYLRAVVVTMTSTAPYRYEAFPSAVKEVLYGEPQKGDLQFTPPPPPPNIEADGYYPQCTAAYTPIDWPETEAYYYFEVFKEPEGLWKNFYQKGQVLYLNPYTPKEKDFWDKVSDAFDTVVNYIKDSVNWVSGAFSSIKASLVNVVAGMIPGCGDTLKKLLSVALDAGLVALGIPPDIPNFDQLMEGGLDYLAESVAETAGIPPEVAKLGIQAMVDASKNPSGSAPKGLDFIRPYGPYQYHPAKLTVTISNPHNIPLQPGSLNIRDRSSIFRPVQISYKGLLPGQSIQIPVCLVENNDYFNLNITDPAPLEKQEWYDKYYSYISIFDISVSGTIVLDEEDKAKISQYGENNVTYYGGNSYGDGGFSFSVNPSMANP